MSFGFGNNNSNTSSTGFGGFGASNTSGFGANNNTATTSSGTLFGGSTATSGGFGGFGANNNQQQNNPFAASKPAFGGSNTATTGGGLFGANTSTSGGFGAGTGGFGNTANTGSGFGASNTGGGIFGQNKPATTGFGTSTTGGSLFGGGSSTGAFGANTGTTANNPFAPSTNTAAAGFGGTNTGTSGFGGGFGASAATTNNNGTATVPFQAFQEKEQTGSVVQAFQSITFQDPYKNQSFEELRVQDYAQGRRYGNTNGQAGAFGQSTGFGGTGQTNTASTGGGLFGNNTATSGSSFGGGFGNNTNTATNNTFGGNTGGGLFGQNKPANGGLFGSSTTTSAPATNPFGGTSGSTGGLFGNNTGGGFGGNTTSNTATTGGGLFGNTNNQPQNTNPFGGASNTGGGLFGQQNKSATGGLFGSTNTNTANTGGGLFGATNNQQPNSNPFGGSINTGGGLFGNSQPNQAKPAGSFGGFGGSTNTGSTFGNNTNTSGGLFGNNNTQANTGGGLFGNQNKPAAGGLFGGSTNTNTGGGLFGNNNQQPNAGGSLFGNTGNTGVGLFGNQNKPATGGLFGNSTGSNAGGGLFGNTQPNQNTNTGGSLFGSTNQNQPNQTSSSFGSTNNQQQQQSNQLHASLTGAPYGNEQLFASLATSNPPVGPLATPLNGAKPAPRKTPSLMASMRLNSPVYTPRGGSIGRNAGYGFSYSTYGTPGSAYTGSLTPGASSLLRPTGSFGSALSSLLNKSISMGNLRGDGTPGEGRSLLRESALSPPGSGAGRYGGGSVRKLNIDRSLRTDLFGPAKEPEQPGRRVRYDSTAGQPDDIPRQQPANEQNALVRTESSETEQESESPALIRAARVPNGPPRQPEMSQVNGSNGALSTVPEDSVPQRPDSAPATQQKPAPKATGAVKKDNEPGEYWTQPALRDLKNMSRQQLQKIGKFVVGRHSVGRVEFGPCDLSTTQLDEICGGIVRLNARSATVYQDDKDKPAMSKALNVPSTIYLENSWPRSAGGRKAVHAREGREYDKHIARLKRVGGTNFVNYDSETGVWQFTVEHFTTYGLDDDDDDEEDFTEQGESSGLSDAPATSGEQPEEETMQSIDTGNGEVDDTFHFKLDRRSQMSVPGGFDEPSLSYDYDDPSADEQMDEDPQEQSEAEMADPFTSSGGAMQAPSPGAVERYHSSMLEDEEQTGDIDMSAAEEGDETEPEMPGAFVTEPKMLRSILKPSRGLDAFASPEKLATELWEEQLHRTISPKKRDRLALREMQQSLMKAREQDDTAESPFKQSVLGRSGLGQSALRQSFLAQKSAKKGKLSPGLGGGEELGKSQAFKTSMDIMNSLWADQKAAKKVAKGFEYPYAKKPRLSGGDADEQNPCLKPSFSADGTLVYSAAGSATHVSGEMVQSKQSIVGEHADVRFAKIVAPTTVVGGTVEAMMGEVGTVVSGKEGEMPSASTKPDLLFQRLAQRSMNDGMSDEHEVAVWHLCSALFDPLDVALPNIEDLPKEHWEAFLSRLRLNAFTAFWSELVAIDVETGLKRKKSAEEKAVLLLTRNDVPAACETLIAARDYRLASLIAQLPGSDTSREVMKRQIEAWQRRKDWSEMSDGVRALYSILAGQVCVVAGQAGPAEDRASGFCIAERFGLTWQQSLGLRVWFGGHATLEGAVKTYCEDLEAGRETVEPSPWHRGRGDDTLMTLCRLFAFEREGVVAAELCEPLTVSGSALNSRVAWQLASILGAKGLAALPEEKMAQLTMSFAADMEIAGRLVESAWVLLHLRGAQRQKAIADLLQRNAAGLPSLGDKLMQQWRIPRSMVFAAQSLYAKASGDSYGQARFLLRAGHIAEAHDVLCTSVGPHVVIEQDNEMLALVNEFPRQRPAGWDKGGQIYEAYLRLVRLNSAQRQAEEGGRAVRALRRALRGVEEADMAGKTLEQRVAVTEMRRVVEEVAKAQGDEHKASGRSADAGWLAAGATMLERYRVALGTVV